MDKFVDNEQNKIVFGYWSIRGTGERIRFLLQYLAIPYKQIRYTLLNKQKWETITKPSLSLKNPAITLPYLIDGQKVITESDAIIVYLVNKAGRVDLLGRNIDQKVKIATILGIQRDLANDFRDLCYGNYDESLHFERARDIFVKEKFKPQLDKLTDLLNHPIQFICGEITIADFILAEFLQILFFVSSQLKDQCGKLSHYQKKFFSFAPIAKYIKSGRFYQRPYHEADAQWR